MSKSRYILGLVILLIFTANAASAEIAVATTYANYPVSGRNLHQIKQAIFSHGPITDESGANFAAKTTAKLSWKYYLSAKSNSCSILAVDVEVAVIYQLPELQNYEALNAADKDEWKRYANATYLHEQGHANLGIETARKVEQQAKTIPPKSSCGEMTRTANMLISNIVRNYEHENIAYDTATNHGTTQGAVLASAD